MLVLFSFFLLFNVNAQISKPIYLDESQPIENRVEDALSRMTLEEKVAMCHAQSKFSSPGVPRLGIPENWATDGPHGIRAEVLWDEWDQAEWTNDSCIAFPALTCLAATWNRDMATLYGKSIGEEARYRNKNILLGPGVNIYRTPLNGRNFEYMGEDPYLASQMVVPYIQGVQSNGVAACVKHFALNNQEIDRHTVNINIDNRALYEIYLPAFKAAVQEGDAWAIMGAYNKYKGEWACHNQYLLNDILRKEWKFDGVVVSDWGGVNDTYQSIYNGLDMEFGTWTDGLSGGEGNAYDKYYLAKPFLKLLKEKKVDEELVNEKVRNILKLTFRTTMNTKRPWGSFGTEEHALAGRRVAEEGIVLLQNKENILPIDFTGVKKILVVGENAIKSMTVGGGSSSLKTKYEVSPLEGLKNQIGDRAEILYARGYVGDANNVYNGVTSGQDLTEHRSAEELLKEAVFLSKTVDLVLFIGGLNKSDNQDNEGHDRKALELSYGQNKLINQLAVSNKNIVVVNISGNAIAMPWKNKVSGIIQSWYNGSEAGNALASILLGTVNPSGKLPFSFPMKLTDIGSHSFDEYCYPGVDKEVIYKEGLFVGYRWLEKKNIKPLFPFGHGLSYTLFDYDKVRVNKKTITSEDEILVSVTVKNIGDKDGSEIVQLYIKDIKSSLPRPEKELKGFEKVYLKVGEEKEVCFIIDKTDLSFFDDEKHEWIAEPGEFEAIIAASSADIKGKIKFTLK